MLTQLCKNGCCNIRFCPLSVAFGRTIHSFQGQEAGKGKPIETIVVNPGPKCFETVNPGTLNCCITRATSIGVDENSHSSIYFTGPHITKSRFHNMTHNSNNEMYHKVKLREKWIQHLTKYQLETETKCQK